MRPHFLIAFLLGLAGPGCSPRKSEPAPTAKQPPAWNWAAYPPVQRMRLATVPCQLQPKSSIAIFSPLAGAMKVYLQQPQTNLQAGFVWAEFEPVIFQAEAEAIEEARLKLEEREKLQLELEVPKQRLQLERQIEEAQRQVALLNLLSTNPELAQLTLNIPGQSSSLLRPEALSKAQTELGLLSQSLHYLEQTNLYVIGVDLAGQRSEWQRRNLDFKRRQGQARMRMPFSGQLTVSLPLTEGVEEYPVTAGQEVAVARDLSLIRLRAPLANPAWTTVPAENLTAMVRMQSGEELEARFAFQKIERFQNREESVYYFQFPPAKAATAARLMGTDVSCELWLTLPEPAHIVPKLTLLIQYPIAYQNRNWAQGVSVTWTGVKLLIEGQTDLAVVRTGGGPK